MSSYKDTLARTALVYLTETGIIALASFLLSFVVLNGIKLSALVDLAVLLLFVKDIEDLPEKTPKTKVALKRIVQALVLFGLSLLLHDTLGGVVYGLTALFLGLNLFERFGERRFLPTVQSAVRAYLALGKPDPNADVPDAALIPRRLQVIP